MHSDLKSIVISGMAKCPGGDYDNVTISGSGKFQGDLNCNTLVVSGMANTANVISKKTHISGTCKCIGTMKTKILDVSGKFGCNGNIESEKVLLSGLINVEKKLISDDLDISGKLNINSDIECETISIYGSIHCNGFINCESFYLDISYKSTLHEIGASKVIIESNLNKISKLFIKKK